MISIPEFVALKPGRRIYSANPVLEWEVLWCYGSPENPSHTEHVTTWVPGTDETGPIFTRLDSYLTRQEAEAASTKC